MKTSYGCESTKLSLILERNFETKLNKARLKLISMVTLALCKTKTIGIGAQYRDFMRFIHQKPLKNLYLATNHIQERTGTGDAGVRRAARWLALAFVLRERLFIISKKTMIAVIFLKRNPSNNHQNHGNHGQKNAHFELPNRL